MTKPELLITPEILARASLSLAAKLPSTVAGVIGIARSGMLPASIIASHLHLPLGELDSFLATGNWLGHGIRLPLYSPSDGPLVVVDDTVSWQRTTMHSARRRMACVFPGRHVLYAAAYISFEDHDLDAIGEVLPKNCRSELQLLTSDAVSEYMVDCDGVLCADPLHPETDSPEWARHFENASPLFLPRRLPVHAIVTSRLEKYRSITEQWLQKHGCRYGKLLMCPSRSVAERSAVFPSPGRWKGLQYKNSPCTLFIESCPYQADEIAKESGKPVLCIADRHFR